MWNGWPLERMLILFTGLAYWVVWGQVSLYHYRGSFRHAIMWAPVLALPLLGISGLALSAWNLVWLRQTYGALLGITAAASAAGSVLHFRAVGLRVGGYESRNFLTGPPVLLPVMLTALSFLGLISLYWRLL